MKTDSSFLNSKIRLFLEMILIIMFLIGSVIWFKTNEKYVTALNQNNKNTNDLVNIVSEHTKTIVELNKISNDETNKKLRIFTDDIISILSDQRLKIDENSKRIEELEKLANGK